MRKAGIALAAIIGILALMTVEYRFIMRNICPYRGANGTVYLEIFGRFDQYYADPIGE